MRLLAFSCVILLCLSLSILQDVQAQSISVNEITNIRYAFKFGTDVALATRTYFRNPDIAESQEILQAYLKDIRSYSNYFNVSIDMIFPPLTGSFDEDRINIVSEMSRRADRTSRSISTRYGFNPGAIFMLGYKTAMAPEYVPDLPSNTQQEIFQEYRDFANYIDLPFEILDKYCRALSGGTYSTAVYAHFDFENEVLSFLEGNMLEADETAMQRLNTWDLGGKLGLVVLGKVQGASDELVERMFQDCRVLAEELEVSLPALHEVTGNWANDMATALHYLLVETGDTIGERLREKYGKRFSALFEFASKSILLTLLYNEEEASNDLLDALMSALNRSGRDSDLPREMWYPLLDKVNQRRSYPEVKAEVAATRDRVKEHLFTLAQSASRNR